MNGDDNKGMYLPPMEFYQRYPNVRGKLYGGDYAWRELIRQMEKVVRAMPRCGRHWTVENDNCGVYIQKVIKVAPRG